MARNVTIQRASVFFAVPTIINQNKKEREGERGRDIYKRASTKKLFIPPTAFYNYCKT